MVVLRYCRLNICSTNEQISSAKVLVIVQLTPAIDAGVFYLFTLCGVE